MRALIVGGDSVEPVRRQLHTQGFTQVAHWTGRKTADCRRPFPSRLDLVVVMLDAINHNLCRRVRQEADRQSLRIVFKGRKSAGVGH